MKASWKQTGLPRGPYPMGLGAWSVKRLCLAFALSIAIHFFAQSLTVIERTELTNPSLVILETLTIPWVAGIFVLIACILWWQRGWKDRTEPWAWVSLAFAFWGGLLLSCAEMYLLDATGYGGPGYHGSGFSGATLPFIELILAVAGLFALVALVQLFRHRSRKGRGMALWCLNSVAWVGVACILYINPNIVPYPPGSMAVMLPVVPNADRLHFDTFGRVEPWGSYKLRPILWINDYGSILNEWEDSYITSDEQVEPEPWGWSFFVEKKDKTFVVEVDYSDLPDYVEPGPFERDASRWIQGAEGLLQEGERPVSDRDIRIFASRRTPFSYVRLAVQEMGAQEVPFWRFCFSVRRWESVWNVLLSGDYNLGNDMFDSPYVGELRMDMEAFRTGKGPPADAARLFVQQVGDVPSWTFDGVPNAAPDELSEVWEASGKQVLLLDAADDVPWGEIVQLLVSANLFEQMQFDLSTMPSASDGMPDNLDD